MKKILIATRSPSQEPYFEFALPADAKVIAADFNTRLALWYTTHGAPMQSRKFVVMQPYEEFPPKTGRFVTAMKNGFLFEYDEGVEL